MASQITKMTEGEEKIAHLRKWSSLHSDKNKQIEVNGPPLPLIDNLKTYLESRSDYDMTITCQDGEKFKVSSLKIRYASRRLEELFKINKEKGEPFGYFQVFGDYEKTPFKLYINEPSALVASLIYCIYFDTTYLSTAFIEKYVYLELDYHNTRIVLPIHKSLYNELAMDLEFIVLMYELGRRYNVIKLVVWAKSTLEDVFRKNYPWRHEMFQDITDIHRWWDCPVSNKMEGLQDPMIQVLWEAFLNKPQDEDWQAADNFNATFGDFAGLDLIKVTNFLNDKEVPFMFYVFKVCVKKTCGLIAHSEDVECAACKHALKLFAINEDEVEVEQFEREHILSPKDWARRYKICYCFTVGDKRKLRVRCAATDCHREFHKECIDPCNPLGADWLCKKCERAKVKESDKMGCVFPLTMEDY